MRFALADGLCADVTQAEALNTLVCCDLAPLPVATAPSSWSQRERHRELPCVPASEPRLIPRPTGREESGWFAVNRRDVGVAVHHDHSHS